MRPAPHAVIRIAVRRTLRAALVMITLAALVVPRWSVPEVKAASTFRYAGVDVMKWTKDTMRNQPSDAQIEAIVSEIINKIHPGYIAISIPMDATSDYNQNNQPAPRTAEAFAQKWADVIHAKGAKVIWRGTWSGIEGIYDFERRVGANRLPTGSASSASSDGNRTWLGKTYAYIVNHPSFFADGDIWAPLPERTEGIFNDATSFISSESAGLQTNYATFHVELKKTSEAAFGRIGKNVVSGLTAQNYSEYGSGWLLSSLPDAAGMLVVDHYGINHTPEEMEADLRKINARYHKPVFLQEWGDYWHPDMPAADRAAYLDSMYAVWKKLASEGILVGFNYWGAWAGNQEGILDQSGSTFQVNARGMQLAKFFADVTGTPQPTPTTPTNPDPKPADPTGETPSTTTPGTTTPGTTTPTPSTPGTTTPSTGSNTTTPSKPRPSKSSIIKTIQAKKRTWTYLTSSGFKKSSPKRTSSVMQLLIKRTSMVLKNIVATTNQALTDAVRPVAQAKTDRR